MGKPKISIVVPVYNQEQYLDECIQSVLHQTLVDIEIICIDDGSTDQSAMMLDTYEKKDARVKVIHKENTGYGHSMNVGIEKASGDYIGIVEPDDYILPYMMETLYNAARRNKAEVVKSNFYRFYGEGSQRVFEEEQLVYNDHLYLKILSEYEIKQLYRGNTANWSGIYKKQFLDTNKIRHHESPGASYQDAGFGFQILSYAKRVYITNKGFYCYRQDNPNSSISDTGKVNCICEEFAFIYDVILKNKGKFRQYLPIFQYCRFNNYMLSYNRIAEKYKWGFLNKISLELKQSYNKGELKLDLFEEEDKRKLLLVMENPEMFHEKEKRMLEAIHQGAAQSKHIIIYGAGNTGRNIFMRMYSSDKEKVVGYAVTNGSVNGKSLGGIPVKEINFYENIKHESVILVAVMNKHISDIEVLLRGQGYENIILCPDGIKAIVLKAENPDTRMS